MYYSAQKQAKVHTEMPMDEGKCDLTIKNQHKTPFFNLYFDASLTFKLKTSSSFQVHPGKVSFSREYGVQPLRSGADLLESCIPPASPSTCLPRCYARRWCSTGPHLHQTWWLYHVSQVILPPRNIPRFLTETLADRV